MYEWTGNEIFKNLWLNKGSIKVTLGKGESKSKK